MSEERKPATIWYSRGSVPTPLGLSAQLGLYDQEFGADGITIKSLQESDNPAELASHFEHNLPDSFRLGGAVQPIWARAKGRDTRVIGISWIDEYQVILALPESGIDQPSALKGRRLGLPRQPAAADGVDVSRAEALRGLLVALETAGLGYNDAEWIDAARFSICLRANLEVDHDHGAIYPHDCRHVRPCQPGPGVLGQSIFLSPYGFCRRKPASIQSDQVVSDGGHPPQVRHQALR